MGDVVLGPYRLGIDNVSPETDLKTDDRGRTIAVRDALNVDFDRDGNFSRRKGASQVLAQVGLHSLWTSQAGVSYCMRGAELCRADYLGGALTLSPIATLGSDSPVSYDDMDGDIVFSNLSSLGVIKPDGQVSSLGIAKPDTPTAESRNSGGLSGGKYSIAVSVVKNGEESALSDIADVEITDNGGIFARFAQGLPDGMNYRLYRTNQNGDVLYRCADIPGSLTEYVIGVGDLGRAADNQFLEKLPRGSIVRAWRGRLLVARNNVLYFSEPMRYGLYSPRHGFVQERRRITLVQPVEAGVFVGTQDGVVFLSGDSPKNWTRVVTGGRPPVPGSGIKVPASILGGEIGQSGSYVAMWLSENGFVVGLPDGSLLQPQAARIKLDAAGVGAMAVFDRRAIVAIK